MKDWLRFHRRVGLVACLGMFCWGVSGMLHPVMTHWQPQPATQMPSVQKISLRNALSLPDVLRRNALPGVTDAHAVLLQGRVTYQLRLPDMPDCRYFDARTGQPVPDGDRRYAESLARYYLNIRHTPVRAMALLTHFTDEYNFINRYLPVYRVDFDRQDGMRAYVQTEGAHLGTLVDNTKGTLSILFNMLHTWAFLNRTPKLKWLMLLLLAAAFSASLSGIALYGLLPRRNGAGFTSPLRRGHRLLGLTVSLTTLSFTLSGGYHLVHGFAPRQPMPEFHRYFTVSELSGAGNAALAARPIAGFGLVRVHGQAAYRIAEESRQSAFNAKDAEHHPQRAQPANAMDGLRYVMVRDGRVLMNGEREAALELARFYSRLSDDRIISLAPVTRFGNEYGFIFKRLPVFRVAFNTLVRDVYFVEPSTGQLAAHITGADAREGWFFANIHKWAFAGPYTEARDWLMALFALGNAVVALTGLGLFKMVYAGKNQPAR